MKKAILIGDYEIARLHPLAGIDDALREIYKDVFEIYTANEKVYPNLNYNSLTQYDLIIFMPESTELLMLLLLIDTGRIILLLKSSSQIPNTLKCNHLKMIYPIILLNPSMTPLNPGTNPSVVLVRLQVPITLLRLLFSSITLYGHIHPSTILLLLR